MLILVGIVALLWTTFSAPVFASEGAEEAVPHGSYALAFLGIAVLLICAKLASLVERFGQPAVLGELVMGVVLGNLVLLGIPWFELFKHDPSLKFLAELGVVILLFQIGLESNVTKMRQVGIRAFMVAVVGVVAPFALGTYIVGPLLLPGLSSTTYLFLGAALTATSVGVTARVFKDLGRLQMREAQIVLGAAVIDDVIGLIILAVISAIATLGAVSIGAISIITGKAILFLIGSITAGHFLAPFLGKTLSKINTGVGMKFTLAISFGLVFAYLAQVIGLAPIVGAFAAGLVLDAVHFKFFRNPEVVEDVKEAVRGAGSEIKSRVQEALDRYAHRHVDDLIEPLAFFLVPLFFVITGMSVDLRTLFDLPTLLVALGITAVAFAGKIAAGLAAGGTRHSKLLVGIGMIPRGEVGLIFATIGSSLGVVPPNVFSVIVIMVIMTTLGTPPILAMLLKRSKT